MRLLNNLIVLMITWSAAAAALSTVASGSQKLRLSDTEIQTALAGNLVGYSPAKWADAGVQEEFGKGGLWRGIYYSRGPVEFTGRWGIQNAELCVSPDKGTIVAGWFAGNRCRAVWRDVTTHRLFLEHLDPRHGRELLLLEVKNIKTLADVR